MKRYTRISGQGLISGFGQVVVLVLVALSALALLAPLRSGRNLRHELDQARRRLAELEVLYPLHAELMALDRPERWPDLQVPAPVKLSEPEVLEVPARFMKIASACAVDLGAVRPLVEQDESGQRVLRVELRARGGYGKLRDFLLQTARLPALMRMEKVEVRHDGTAEQFTILAVLALEQGSGQSGEG